MFDFLKGAFETMNKIFHVGISGGKDSTALLLWMVHESGIPRDKIICSFCDTQNEAQETYNQIRLLSEKVLPVIWLQTEGFIQLAKRKGRFPSTKARFCTQELKLLPTKKFIEELSNKYDEIIPVSGVRRNESFARSQLSEWGNPLESYFGLQEWRPLIDWQIEDILTIHEKYNIPLNPLYGMGAKRVGCFPCINSSKQELRILAKSFPQRIDEIRTWENEFKNLNGISTFFPRSKVPFHFRSKTITTKNGEPVKVCTIDDVVKWAKTGWRGHGESADTNSLFQFELDHMAPAMCLNQYTACE